MSKYRIEKHDNSTFSIHGLEDDDLDHLKSDISVADSEYCSDLLDLRDLLDKYLKEAGYYKKSK